MSWQPVACLTAALTVVAAGGAVRAAGPGDLPPLPLESLSEIARSELEPAYRAAAAATGEALPEAIGRVAMLLHAYEQYSLAVEWYGAARRRAPQAFDWVYGEALARAAMGDDRAARDLYERALALDPGTLAGRIRLADLLFAAGDHQRSRDLYTLVLRDAPDTPQAHYGLGRVAAAEGRLAEAVAHLERACQLFDAYGAARYALAIAYRDLGRHDEAARELERYAKVRLGAPPLADPFMVRLRDSKQSPLDLLAEAARLGEAGRIDESIAAHLTVLERDPSLVQAHVNLLSLYARREQWAEVDTHYQRAIASNPGLAEAHYNYGVALVAQRRTDEARAAFERAIAVNPHHARARNNLGQMLEAAGRLADARAQYEAAVASDPRERIARYNLGRMLVALGSPTQAIPHFEALLQPEDDRAAQYLFAISVAHARTGNLAAAREYGDRARARARELGQAELAAAIDRELARLPAQTP